eukprot:GAHX01001129.1.p1 GENE.GAHX01001129.1~~GAHX01001129.1.p1  ORF type:complete len:1479 (-),score=304.22 GAHX01001129.1:45-4436(-)
MDNKPTSTISNTEPHHDGISPIETPQIDRNQPPSEKLTVTPRTVKKIVHCDVCSKRRLVTVETEWVRPPLWNCFDNPDIEYKSCSIPEQQEITRPVQTQAPSTPQLGIPQQRPRELQQTWPVLPPVFQNQESHLLLPKPNPAPLVHQPMYQQTHKKLANWELLNSFVNESWTLEEIQTLLKYVLKFNTDFSDENLKNYPELTIRHNNPDECRAKIEAILAAAKANDRRQKAPVRNQFMVPPTHLQRPHIINFGYRVNMQNIKPGKKKLRKRNIEYDESGFSESSVTESEPSEYEEVVKRPKRRSERIRGLDKVSYKKEMQDEFPNLKEEASEEEETKLQRSFEQAPKKRAIGEIPAEDKLEKILAVRTKSLPYYRTIMHVEDDQEDETDQVEAEEFLIKFDGLSYIHVKWFTEAELKTKFGKRAVNSRLQNFRINWPQLELEQEELYNGEYFPPDYLSIDRILDSRVDSNTGKEMYLIKWGDGLPYSQSTWEDASNISDELKIAEYLRFNRPPRDLKPRQLDALPEQKMMWYRGSGKEYKSGHRLRSYQLDGLNWLIGRWWNGKNCILADEMGLGKTIQSVSFIDHIKTIHNMRGPFLIVVPLSTIEHWKREIESWTDMNVVVYHDPYRGKESRKFIRDHEFYFKNMSQTGRVTIMKFNVLLTTYETVKSDADELSRIRWVCLIVDEGHRLKNREAKIVSSFDNIQAQHRVLLTGTPIQNNTGELWALLNFISPKNFGNKEDFDAQFADLVTSEQVEKLKNYIGPYILRRVKEDVEKSIPPLEEAIIDCELTTIQKKYYRAVLERNRDFLVKSSNKTNLPNLLNVEMQLRKCCNHPWLIKGTEEKDTIDIKTNEEYINKLIETSGKMVLLAKLLPKLKKEGHRVLLFSQMKGVLDIIEKILYTSGYLFERLDGNTRGNERQRSVDRFCAPNSDKFIFLLTTRAGGLGLNLTVADTVIIFDSDWNPQQDVQAQARCHRIGQDRPVVVYRLITKATYESEMFERASKKLGIDHAIMNTLNKGRKEFATKEEFEKMLRYGVYSILEDDESAKKFQEQDIEDILKRNVRKVSKDTDNANKQVSFTRMNFLSDTSDSSLDVNAPDFWEKILKIEDTKQATNEEIEANSLLNQLTDRSVTKSNANIFFRSFKSHIDKSLRKKEKGDVIHSLETDIALLIQIGTMKKVFSEYQRDHAANCLKNLEKRTRRKADSSAKEEVFEYEVMDSKPAQSNKPKQGQIKPIWPGDICETCFCGGKLLACENCKGKFHKKCTKGDFLCDSCALNVVTCFKCDGEKLLSSDCIPKAYDSIEGEYFTCIVRSCNRSFHKECCDHSSGLKHFLDSVKGLRCPKHTCHNCHKVSGTNLLYCQTCPKAFHFQCLPIGQVARLTSKKIFCKDCLPKVKENCELSRALIVPSVNLSNKDEKVKKEEIEKLTGGISNRFKPGKYDINIFDFLTLVRSEDGIKLFQK